MPFSLSVGRILALSMLAAGLLVGRLRQPAEGARSRASPARRRREARRNSRSAVGDRVFFETDSSALTAQSQATLDRQVQWLAQYPQYAFTIEGHADERGTREYNLALGARRATAVRDYMIARGIPANRMHTISYGKERPVAVCDDISCWSQNRRAVTAAERRLTDPQRFAAKGPPNRRAFPFSPISRSLAELLMRV